MNFDFNSIATIWSGLPRFVQALIVLVGGWLGALLSRAILHGLLKLLRFDRLAGRLGFVDFLKKGHVAYQPSRLVGVAAYWVVLLATILSAARLLDIGVINQFSDVLISAVPRFLAALMVLGVGLALVFFLANVAETVMANMAFSKARLAVKAIRWIGVGFIVLLSVDQLGLGQSLISQMFLISFAALALGLALAFGIGSTELAKEVVRDFLRNLREKERGSHGADLEG